MTAKQYVAQHFSAAIAFAGLKSCATSGRDETKNAVKRCATSVAVSLALVAPAFAQMTGAPAPGFRRDAGQPASAIPAPLREIGFDQHVGDRLPLDTRFRDEAGRDVRLGDYFGARPVVMVFAYYDCPMLCTLSINGVASALNILSLTAGADFEVVIVSFDPRDTPAAAAAKKATYVARYTHPGAEHGWHFLIGDATAIDRVTKAAGFRYAWDADTRQFAHPTGVMVLTADGRLARYLFGIEYGPRDLRFALVEASGGRLGSPADALLLYCYHYDPMTGRYGLAIMRTIRIAGAGTVLALGTFIVVMLRRERIRGVVGADPRVRSGPTRHTGPTHGSAPTPLVVEAPPRSAVGADPSVRPGPTRHTGPTHGSTPTPLIVEAPTRSAVGVEPSVRPEPTDGSAPTTGR